MYEHSSALIIEKFGDNPKGMFRRNIHANDTHNEKWLQDLIDLNARILPTMAFGEEFHPLFSLGTEIESGSGPIDNLLVSRRGKLVLVETKLWKNAEQHRMVIAQILDYAKQLSSWSYERLEQAVLKSSKAHGGAGSDLLTIMEPFIDKEGLSRGTIQDEIASSLRRGEFLLLIVGERVSPNLILLSEMLQSAPHLDFRFGLVELQLFSPSKNDVYPLVIVPHIVGRTVEQNRATVEITYRTEQPAVVVTVSNNSDERIGKTNESKFLADLSSDAYRSLFKQFFRRCDDEKLHIRWGTKGLSLRVEPKLGRPYSLVEMYPDDKWGISLVRLSLQQERGIPQEAYGRYSMALRSVPAAHEKVTQNKLYLTYDRVQLEELQTILDATIDLARDIEA